MVGIIFAMKEELDALKEIINITKEYQIFDLIFYEGNLNNKKCIMVESGVGKVNASRVTQVLIDNFNVDYVFNIGVAGGVDSSLKVGDIVIGEKLVQHDFNITAFNHERGYVPKVGMYLYSDTYLVKLAKENIEESKIGVIASGDIFCVDEKMTSKINQKFKALCVEMEGAAIGQTCYLCGVPFLVIRSVSDIPNNDNVITYEEFLLMSSKKVALAMKNLLNNLN